MCPSNASPELPPQSDIRTLLRAAQDGFDGADARLVDGLYAELRGIADRMMARERASHTLQATALVHEAWLAVADGDWASRQHFFGAAAQAMRRVLVDSARRRLADKRGGTNKRVTLQDLVTDAPESSLDVIALDAALTDLGAFDRRLAEVVQLRFFAGLSIAEVATLQRVSPATVKRDWSYARAWLFERMEGERA